MNKAQIREDVRREFERDLRCGPPRPKKRPYKGTLINLFRVLSPHKLHGLGWARRKAALEASKGSNLMGIPRRPR